MNVLIGGILLCICSCVGFYVASGYRKKLLFIQDFKNFLDFVETNVMFTQDKISVLLESKKDSFHKEFLEFITNYLSNIQDVSSYLTKYVQEQKLLDKDTAELIANFMRELGRIDSTTQLQSIKQANEALSTHLTRTQDEQKKGTMSARLGVMGGLALFIIVL